MAPQLGAENLNKLDRTFTWSHLTQTDVETGTLVYQTVLVQGIVKGIYCQFKGPITIHSASSNLGRFSYIPTDRAYKDQLVLFRL